MPEWLTTLTGWLADNPQWLGLSLFLVACLECLAVVGLLMPGTVLIFGIAVLAARPTSLPSMRRTTPKP